MTSRLEKLQLMLQTEPDDTFLRYALAMELRSLGRFEECLETFQSLMTEAHHVPAFFMAAQTWAELGRLNEARQALRDGIALARSQGDHHAAGEMSELLASLGAMGE